MDLTLATYDYMGKVPPCYGSYTFLQANPAAHAISTSEIVHLAAKDSSVNIRKLVSHLW